MAGDWRGHWLKIEVITPDKEEVIGIGERLGITREEAFGRLFRVWAWAQAISPNGHVRVRNLSAVDHEARLQGFGQAMAEMGWITPSEGGFNIPKWDRHLSKGAKKRALDAERKRASREKPVRDPSAPEPDKDRTRGRDRVSSSSTKKKSARTPRGGMPEGWDGAEDLHVKAWYVEHGWPEGLLALHWEAFKISVEKTDLHYAGERGWRAAFMGAVRDDWAQLRMNAATRGKGGTTQQWIDELTGGAKGSSNGERDITGVAERVD